MREVSIYSKIAAAAIVAILAIGCAASAITNDNEPEKVDSEVTDGVSSDTEVLEVEDIPAEDAVAEDEAAISEQEYSPVFERFEWQDYGYESAAEWFNDMKSKHEGAIGIADETIGKYSGYVTDEQEKQLREYESIMSSTFDCSDYDDAKAKFDDIVEDLIVASTPKPKPTPSTGGGNSGGNYDYNYNGGSTPYNFKVMGILYETNWRWTYYSSRVLYHYMTPQWWADENGIWRDSNGYAIVACDAYPWGTIIETELFGTCLVYDNGVGRSDTLDLYVNW